MNDQGKRAQKGAKQDQSVEEMENGREDDGARRIEEIRAKRAARGPMDDRGFTQKLSISDERKDKRFTYRWALAAGNRIHDLKAKDWEIAPGSTTAGDDRDTGVGSVPERMGNVRTTKEPEKVVLMRKPKEFYEEDKARRQAKIKNDEEAIRRTGDVRDPQGLSGPGSYIPAGGMKIERGR